MLVLDVGVVALVGWRGGGLGMGWDAACWMRVAV